MIGEFEQYHGAAIRDLIVGAGQPLRIEASDDRGRVNTFVVNDEIGIYLKHSSKRLPPWQFMYSDEHSVEIERLAVRCRTVWLLHVCGLDGVVVINLVEFLAMNPAEAETTCFVRVDRDRNTMYRVNGTGGKLPRPKRRGLAAIFEDLRA